MWVRRRSFRVVLPSCPRCGSSHVRVDRRAGNILRIVADAVLGVFLLFPFVPYAVRCSDCGTKFSPDLRVR